MYVGRIEPRRNTIFLLDVFREVYEDNKDIRLLIVGRGEDEYKEKCFEHAKEIGIQNAIIYEEYLDQKYLPLVYSYSDVFLLPTSYEIFGMVLLEAMYFGAPAITTYNGGSSMLIKNGQNGIIIDNFQISDWKESVQRLLCDDILKSKIVENAKFKIENEFTWEALADKFIEVFEKRINEGNKS